MLPPAHLPYRYLVIFQNYAHDLEVVQKLYEKHKYEPPVPRNAPPVTGNIMWARQLLRRIESPMLKFAQVRTPPYPGDWCVHACLSPCMHSV